MSGQAYPSACRPSCPQSEFSQREDSLAASDCRSTGPYTIAGLPARAASLRKALHERDLAVLASLARARLMTAGQIQRLHIYTGSATTQHRRTRSVLQRLHDLHLVVRMGRVVGGVRAGSSGYVYGLSGLGLAVLDLPGTYGRRRRATWETKPAFADHVLMVSELYVRLDEACRYGSAELLAFDAEPACWRRFTGSGGETVTLKPDAFICTGTGEIERSVFAEIDLATESPNTIQRKCQVYVAYWRTGSEQQHHGVFPLVLWLVPHLRRQQRLTEVIQRLSADVQALFAVALFDHGTTMLTAPEGGGR